MTGGGEGSTGGSRMVLDETEACFCEAYLSEDSWFVDLWSCAIGDDDDSLSGLRVMSF